MTASNQAALPTWDLSHLYQGIEDQSLASDLDAAHQRAQAFEVKFKDRLASITPAEFAEAIETYDALWDSLGKIMSFAQLLYAGDNQDQNIGSFYQTMQERVNDISAMTLFFVLEINRLDDAVLETYLMGDERVRRFGPWLRDTRVYRPHQLDDILEKMLHEKAVAGRAAWNRLFDETMSSLRFPFDDKELTVSEVLDKMSSKDGEVRRQAAKTFGTVLGDNIKLFSLVTNTLAKDKAIDDKWRKFAKPISSRNLSNLVEDEVVDALITSVRSAYPRLSHRYYALKAKWFGVEKLNYWDRNAPLPEDDDSRIPWDKAQEIVLSAYHRFEPEMAKVAKRFFDERWIDAGPRAGKDSGAFAHPTVPSAHPYVLMNFHGKVRDVMTLAHELGHGVHQVLAAKQGCLLADTPLTLAETASVFGEMLTFQSMLADESDPKRKRVMLASKVEDMLNTVVRQIAFCQFEIRLHDARAKGEVSADRIGEIWMEVQRESLGSAFNFDEEYRHYWAYIPHFINSPFYVYAYAFGDCLVNSLYDAFKQGQPEFQKKYLAMLSAGGTLRHKELLAPFGLDASDPEFWGRGLKVLERFIDELESLS